MATQDFTDSAMVALIPRDEDAEKFALPGAEPPEELHVTVVFLGEAQAVVPVQDTLLNVVRQFAHGHGPLNLKAWATANFNPTGDSPCAVYLVGGDGGDLDNFATGIQQTVQAAHPALPPQHTPWVPHLTVGYGATADQLTMVGQPITFDRLRLAIGGERLDIPLDGGGQESIEDLAAALDSRLTTLESRAMPTPVDS